MTERPIKDGLEEAQTLHAKDWREALNMPVAPGKTIYCDDGWCITWGETVVFPVKAK